MSESVPRVPENESRLVRAVQILSFDSITPKGEKPSRLGFAYLPDWV